MTDDWAKYRDAIAGIANIEVEFAAKREQVSREFYDDGKTHQGHFRDETSRLHKLAERTRKLLVTSRQFAASAGASNAPMADDYDHVPPAQLEGFISQWEKELSRAVSSLDWVDRLRERERSALASTHAQIAERERREAAALADEQRRRATQEAEARALHAARNRKIRVVVFIAAGLAILIAAIAIVSSII